MNQVGNELNDRQNVRLDPSVTLVSESAPSVFFFLLLLLPIVQLGPRSPLAPFRCLVLISSHEISLHLRRPGGGAVPPL